jgi:cyclopropane fatty-acyl-phospholipid synthase-like methyltransferase
LSAAGDIPSPIDFHDPDAARAWVADLNSQRAARAGFFEAFAQALRATGRDHLRVLELGSGPGMLAEHLLEQVSIEHYVLLDFSEAMHALARARLADELAHCVFETRDFRAPDWGDGLGRFDAVVTQQAAHEVRHKRHLPKFLAEARALLRPGGTLLFCDHYSEAGSEKNPQLYFSKSEQPHALRKAGFEHVALLRDDGGMALYRGSAA